MEGSASAVDGSAIAHRSDDTAGLAQRRLGPLLIRYDPDRLAAVDSSIEVPPDWDRSVSGLKLIAADRQESMGQERCEYGLSGMQMECQPASEAGMAFAILDEDYQKARERSAEGATSVEIAGVQGVRWSIGAEGEGAEFTLIPVDGRTALIDHRTRMRENPDPGAIEQAKEKLRIER